MTAVLRDLSNHPYCFTLAASNEKYAGKKAQELRLKAEFQDLSLLYSLTIHVIEIQMLVGLKLKIWFLVNYHVKSMFSSILVFFFNPAVVGSECL